jgi:glutathione synthase/RimK-type ligase-like ATP-grasp enzyme
MTEMYSVPFTSSYDGALHWIEEGETVVCRTVLNGHSGKGIVIAETVDELVDAPLYTKYIKKKSEWRVHIFNGQVIDIQRKVRNNDVEEVNWRVRNHANGFIYQRNNLAPPDCVLKAAVGAMNLTLLDFGAVDVIYNEHYDKAYVLEINCAPGLEGTTVERYVEAFRAL